MYLIVMVICQWNNPILVIAAVVWCKLCYYGEGGSGGCHRVWRANNEPVLFSKGPPETKTVRKSFVFFWKCRWKRKIKGLSRNFVQVLLRLRVYCYLIWEKPYNVFTNSVPFFWERHHRITPLASLPLTDCYHLPCPLNGHRPYYSNTKRSW